jgi:hypothetical protein
MPGLKKRKKQSLKTFNFKQLARKRVFLALNRGRITKLSCEVCNDPDTQAHHNNYNKPLEIRWLCKKHHYQLHKVMRELLKK